MRPENVQALRHGCTHTDIGTYKADLKVPLGSEVVALPPGNQQTSLAEQVEREQRVIRFAFLVGIGCESLICLPIWFSR